jgi:hypothetical protein
VKDIADVDRTSTGVARTSAMTWRTRLLASLQVFPMMSESEWLAIGPVPVLMVPGGRVQSEILGARVEGGVPLSLRKLGFQVTLHTHLL